MKTLFKNSSRELGGLPGLLLLLISVFITFACAQLLEWDEQGNLLAHSYSVWGDWSVHFTYISQFRERGIGWIFGENPLFQGVPFQYPFLSHFFTQAFASMGSTLGFWASNEVVKPTFLISLILTFLLPFALFFGFRSLSLKPMLSVMSTFIFLFVGGLQFLDSSLNPALPLTNQTGGPYFTHFLMFEFFPQRAFVFGLVGFLFLGGWALRKTSIERMGLCLVLFPFFLWMHVHTWIALAFLLMNLFFFPIEPKKRKSVFLFGLGVAAISVVLMKVYLFRSSLPEVYQEKWPIFSPGWAPQIENPIWFWIYQTGVFLPLSIYGFYLHRKNFALTPFFATGVMIFVLAFLFRFQPSYYDNLKLFTYSFLFLTPFAALAIFSFFQKKMWAPIGAILLISLCASGVQDTLFFAQKKETALFFSKAEFELAEDWKSARASANDVVLIAPKHNHWVPCLSGSPVWMGYPGWLWSWGINYREREHQVNEVLTGGPQSEKWISQNKVHYAVLNTRDQVNQQPVNIEYFVKNYKLIFSKNDWMAFDLTEKAHSHP